MTQRRLYLPDESLLDQVFGELVWGQLQQVLHLDENNNFVSFKSSSKDAYCLSLFIFSLIDLEKSTTALIRFLLGMDRVYPDGYDPHMAGYPNYQISKPIFN